MVEGLGAADLEGVNETGSTTSIRLLMLAFKNCISRVQRTYDDVVVVSPLLAENLFLNVVVGNNRKAVVGVVRAHDAPSVGIDDGALERGQVGGAQHALTTVNGGGVDTLLRSGKSGLYVVSLSDGDVCFVSTLTKCLTMAQTFSSCMPLT